MSNAATPLSPSIPDPVTNEINPTIAYTDQLFTRKHIAAWIGVHPDTLAIWERQPRGLKLTQANSRVRYRVGDVLQWLSGQRGRGHPPRGRVRKAKQKFRS